MLCKRSSKRSLLMILESFVMYEFCCFVRRNVCGGEYCASWREVVKISARVSTYHPYLSDFIDISVVVYVGGALIGCRFGGRRGRY